MADKKISQLPVGEINSTSIFPLVTDGITSKVSFDDMADAFGGGVDLPRIFKGVFNQEGTNDPVIQEFYNNTTFGSFNFVRNSEGVYYTSVSGNFIAYINVGQNVQDPESRVTAFVTYEPKANETQFYINTYAEGVFSDNVVTNMFFEIGLNSL